MVSNGFKSCLPVVPARGGAEVALGIYYKTFLTMLSHVISISDACSLMFDAEVLHELLGLPLRATTASTAGSDKTSFGEPLSEWVRMVGIWSARTLPKMGEIRMMSRYTFQVIESVATLLLAGGLEMFGTFLLFHTLGIIIPFDFHIFQRGSQPPPD